MFGAAIVFSTLMVFKPFTSSPASRVLEELFKSRCS